MPKASEFVDEMLTLAYEAANLWEFPLPTVDLVDGVHRNVRGPWRPEDCRSVLLAWLKAGWAHCEAIALVKDRAGTYFTQEYKGDWVQRASRVNVFHILHDDDAEAFIVDVEGWSDGDAASIQFAANAEYYDRPLEQWVDLLDGLPEELIYESHGKAS